MREKQPDQSKIAELLIRAGERINERNAEKQLKEKAKQAEKDARRRARVIVTALLINEAARYKRRGF